MGVTNEPPFTNGPEPSSKTSGFRRSGGTVIRWAGLPAVAALLIGAVAAIAQVLDYLNGKTVLLVVATGLVLAVAPIAPLARRGEGAVAAGVAVLLCLLMVCGGIITGYGVRGGFVPGTPWAPGLTGNAGPRIPEPAPPTAAPDAPVTDSAAPVGTTAPPSTIYPPTELLVNRGGCGGGSAVDMDVPQTGPNVENADFEFTNCAGPRNGEIRVIGGVVDVAMLSAGPPTREACDQALRTRTEASGPRFLPVEGQIICFTNTNSGLSRSGRPQQINALVIGQVRPDAFTATAYGWPAV